MSSVSFKTNQVVHQLSPSCLLQLSGLGAFSTAVRGVEQAAILRETATDKTPTWKVAIVPWNQKFFLKDICYVAAYMIKPLKAMILCFELAQFSIYGFQALRSLKAKDSMLLNYLSLFFLMFPTM